MKFELKKTQASGFDSAELIKKEFFKDSFLPLVVRPRVPGLELSRFLMREKKAIDADLLKYGAILFRGFDIENVEKFEQVVKSYDPGLLSYKERSTPRTALGANVYTATEYPADQYIPLHNENAYSHQFPLKLWFCCLIPAETGGETPLADNRRVTDLLSRDTIELFKQKRVMYTRNFTTGIDLDWKTAFQTDSPAEVEEYCRKADIEFRWKDDGNLQTRQIRPAMIEHPLTGEEIWFNQAHLFHVSSLDEKLQKDLLETTEPEALTRNAFFGDGSEIPASLLEEIRTAFRKCQTRFRWAKGDILLVDNLYTSHARNPFIGRRRVIVAMCELYKPDNG